MPAIISLLTFAFMLYCVLDVVLTDSSRVRNLPKLAWLLLVVVLPLIGGMVWLLAGRPESGSATPGGQGAIRQPGGQHPSAPGGTRSRGARDRHPSARRPRGPDDDPDFLRKLERQLRERPDDEGGGGGRRRGSP